MGSRTVLIEITVGICAYNEDMNIGKLLNNILNRQDLPPDSEVMVVCSGCTDGTVPLVQEYSKQDSRVHVYVETERKGKASAINHILQTAKGNTILFISADTFPNDGCFRKLLLK